MGGADNAPVNTVFPLEPLSTGTENCSLRDTLKFTPRLLLQLLGTDAGRNIVHPNIWVNALMSDYRQIGSPLVVAAKGLEPGSGRNVPFPE